MAVFPFIPKILETSALHEVSAEGSEQGEILLQIEYSVRAKLLPQTIWTYFDFVGRDTRSPRFYLGFAVNGQLESESTLEKWCAKN